MRDVTKKIGLLAPLEISRISRKGSRTSEKASVRDSRTARRDASTRDHACDYDGDGAVRTGGGKESTGCRCDSTNVDAHMYICVYIAIRCTLSRVCPADAPFNRTPWRELRFSFDDNSISIF